MKIMGALGASMLPILGILILQVASVVPLISCCAWPALLVLYLWMGYAIKMKGFELADSAVVGAIAGLGAGILWAVAGFLMNMFGAGLANMIGSGSAAVNPLANAIAGGIIGTVCGVLLFPVCGAIVAVIGYFVGGMLGKK
jgi:hypothetical protein